MTQKTPIQPHSTVAAPMVGMPADAQANIEAVKKKLEQLQKKIMDRFGEDYILFMSLLPPNPEKKDDINVLLLIDDSDSKKMAKDQLKTKLIDIIGKMAKEVDEHIIADPLLLTELWQYCYDAKVEILQTIAMSVPIYDRGMLAAIKIAEVHKQMVLKKFEKYIVSYVLGGSLVQGTATSKSDVDVFVIIDDTDVKKMTRAELKDKLRAIIVDMGFQAADITGIQNKINIQVYILTDFWDSVKEAHPVIFTFLRDGVPFYDRGVFMPWKQLLQMGRVKPSPEAIDMYMTSGEQFLQRVKLKLKEIAMEDFFWAILTPTQAAIMMYGHPPPTPKETVKVMEDLFVKKDKLLEPKYIKIMDRVLRTRKDMEHGDKVDTSGTEIDELLKDCEDYTKRLKKLFQQIEEIKEKETVLHMYENSVTIARDILKLEGISRVAEKDLLSKFDEVCKEKGVIPERYVRMFKEIVKAKKDYDADKLTPSEVKRVVKDARELLNFMIEYIQRRRGQELEKTKIRVKHGKKFGEVVLLEKEVFIIHDIDAEEKEVSRGKLDKKGNLLGIVGSTLEELESSLMAVEFPEKVFIKEPIFEDLRKIFGKDVEILIHY